MLYWLWEQADWASGIGGSLPDHLTLRTLLAALCSFGLAVVLGPRLILWLQARYREPIVSDCKPLERLQTDKRWTPTMGGLFITAGIVAATLLLADWQNPYLPAALILLVGLSLVGYCDDRLKVTFGKGLRAGSKLAAQAAVAIVVALVVYGTHRDLAGGLELVIPCTDIALPLGLGFIPLTVLVVLSSSNAVNLSDGLDGLAGGCLLCSLTAVGGMAYVAGHAEWAAQLSVPHVRGASELTIVAGAAIGAILGFLWFNCHPAQVFMGDTGSLPLGGLLGLLAVVARQELLLIVVAGVFVAEALSVILQVGSYRWRRRRIFRCAPLHHHFQLSGCAENKIVVRFWIASALCAILGLAALKGGQDARPVPPAAPAQSARTH
ncbi:MAG: phospho-N-acetylmuramoyl-pentapeptide-transferase [Planctomycetales bacterium]|nr:phospho-N-acetylmuramoyl-pentapeptide-transferase [Planctomycetales bacterium]NIM08368.1 phospho-N-acetylmuramoyl-pentapeptide-transferase [Planctomycetales bacterium]NIN07844.1 phospho-N-acetylmuramoyl-pentapeptide-transferase [Planctomycetales bacterium]NIN76972.1 phospho-N-acetylmuramoyl-pentapeptide-transferase [Planctomycetales bacterium]NIO34156.1 phospho-N-acetylmuramoyl-pentapeptide-transferase [Planctomycetales bacterium]